MCRFLFRAPGVCGRSEFPSKVAPNLVKELPTLITLVIGTVGQNLTVREEERVDGDHRHVVDFAPFAATPASSSAGAIGAGTGDRVICVGSRVSPSQQMTPS